MDLMKQVNWTDFWQSRWESGVIPFHQNSFEALLSKFPSVVGKKIFVPLSGKTLDMVYFANQGNQVLGIELSLIACESFFTENQIEFERSVQGEYTVFKSTQITLFCGDFFKVPTDFLSGVDVVYDRAALIALPENLRTQYIEQMIRLLRHGNSKKLKQIFLIALEYESKTPDRPPFSVNQACARQLYQNDFEIKELSSEVDLGYFPHDRVEDKTEATERAYLLTLIA